MVGLSGGLLILTLSIFLSSCSDRKNAVSGTIEVDGRAIAFTKDK